MDFRKMSLLVSIMGAMLFLICPGFVCAGAA